MPTTETAAGLQVLLRAIKEHGFESIYRQALVRTGLSPRELLGRGEETALARRQMWAEMYDSRKDVRLREIAACTGYSESVIQVGIRVHREGGGR